MLGRFEITPYATLALLAPRGPLPENTSFTKPEVRVYIMHCIAIPSVENEL